jgi:hypothetical protein
VYTVGTRGALTDRFILDGPNQLNEIGINNSNGFDFAISPTQIVNLLQTSDVAIAARNEISVQEPINASGNIRKSDLTLSAPSVEIRMPITLNGGNISINSIDSIRSSADRIRVSELNTNGGNITLSGPRIEINTLNSKGGSIAINGPTFVSFATIDSATGARSSAAGNILFSSTIDGRGIKEDLTIKAKGDVTVLGNIGTTSPLGLFFMPSGSESGAKNVSLKGLVADRLLMYVSGNVTIASPTNLTTEPFIRSGDTGSINITANGNITFNSASIDTNNFTAQGQFINIEGNSIKARQNLTFQTPTNLIVQNLALGAGKNLTLNAGQTLTLQNVKSNDNSESNLNTIALQGNVIAITNSQLLARQDLTASATDTLTLDNNQIQAYRDLKLQSTNNLTISNGSSLLAGRDLNLTSTNAQLNISDTAAKPIDIRSLNNLTLSAPNAITINALNRPQSIFRSGNDLKLASNGPITGNGRFVSGNNFVTQTIAGTPGDFRYNPTSSSGIVSATGDITFGNYTGNSLKVEAGGSITAGDITINAADPTLQGTDPEIALLATSPTLILRAGLTPLTQTPNVLPTATERRNTSNLLPGFASSAIAIPNKARITTGNIKIIPPPLSAAPTIRDAVILSAPDGITTGQIISEDGNVRLNANQGNITVSTISARFGGEIAIDTQGLFRATDRFDFSYQIPDASSITSPTSILSGNSSYAINLNGELFPGNIRIRSGAQSFVESYVPGPLDATASGTAGLILRADGRNASLTPSYRDRIFLQNQGLITPSIDPGAGGNPGAGSNPGAGGNPGAGSNPGTQTQVPPDATADRTRTTCKPTTAIAQTNTTRSTNCPTTNPAPSDDSAILKILQ